MRALQLQYTENITTQRFNTFFHCINQSNGFSPTLYPINEGGSSNHGALSAPLSHCSSLRNNKNTRNETRDGTDMEVVKSLLKLKKGEKKGGLIEWIGRL